MHVPMRWGISRSLELGGASTGIVVMISACVCVLTSSSCLLAPQATPNAACTHIIGEGLIWGGAGIHMAGPISLFCTGVKEGYGCYCDTGMGVAVGKGEYACKLAFLFAAAGAAPT